MDFYIIFPEERKQIAIFRDLGPKTTFFYVDPFAMSAALSLRLSWLEYFECVLFSQWSIF